MAQKKSESGSLGIAMSLRKKKTNDLVKATTAQKFLEVCSPNPL